MLAPAKKFVGWISTASVWTEERFSKLKCKRTEKMMKAKKEVTR